MKLVYTIGIIETSKTADVIFVGGQKDFGFGKRFGAVWWRNKEVGASGLAHQSRRCGIGHRKGNDDDKQENKRLNNNKNKLNTGQIKQEKEK